MSELAIRNEAIGQEVMPSFDFLLEESRKRMLFWQNTAPG